MQKSLHGGVSGKRKGDEWVHPDFQTAADLARLPLLDRTQVQRDPEYLVSQRQCLADCLRTRNLQKDVQIDVRFVAEVEHTGAGKVRMVISLPTQDTAGMGGTR